MTKWGNNLLAARWNHIWSPKLFSNLTATYGYYTYKLQNDHSYSSEEEFSGRRSVADLRWRFNSDIQDIGLKLDFDFYPHPKHEVKFGGGSLYHRFQPGFARISFYSNFDRFEDFKYQSDSSLIEGLESHIYLEDQWTLHPRIRLHTGAHAVHYRVGAKTYNSLQPRLSLFWKPADRFQVKASYASMAQFIHLLTNPGVDLPSDRWVPATENIPPQRSEQLAIGSWYQLPEKGISLGVEAYYKRFKDLITYQSAEDFYNQAVKWQNFVEKNGSGETYGIEFLARKTKGKTTGWLAYTLSWNYRQFENINRGKPFPYRYDRRHDINIALLHELTPKISFSANWVYGTGNAITLTNGLHNSFMQDIGQQSLFDMRGLIGTFSDERNNFRMESYHRLDIAFTFKKEVNWGERSWSLGIFNVYNRENPYFYFYVRGSRQGVNGVDIPRVSLYKQSIFSAIPSIRYNFSF